MNVAARFVRLSVAWSRRILRKWLLSLRNTNQRYDPNVVVVVESQVHIFQGCVS
jgi:hypothetical protein